MDKERAKKLLAEERSKIEDAIARADRSEPLESDDHIAPGHGGSASLTQDELDAGLSESHRHRLAALEAAEARLADGTYGESVVSGDPIPDERLEANPIADRTVDEERSTSP